MQRSGQLSLEHTALNREIEEGGNAFEIYGRAVDGRGAVEGLTEEEAARAAEVERLEFLDAEMAQRLNHVSREIISLLTGLRKPADVSEHGSGRQRCAR